MFNNNFLLSHTRIGWLLANAGAVQSQLFAGSYTLQGQGLCWHPGGNDLFVLDNQYDRIYHFRFATAWDITSTMTLIGYKSVSNEVSNTAGGIAFSTNGLMILLVSYSTNSVTIITLKTAWVVVGDSIESESSFTLPGISSGVGFDSISLTADGLHLYVSKSSSSKIYAYSLTTAFDVTTSSLIYTFAFTSPVAAYIKPDGKHIYIINSTKIFDYKMEIANDLQNATLVNSIGLMIAGATALTFSKDGFYLYMLNSLYSRIYSQKLSN